MHLDKPDFGKSQFARQMGYFEREYRFDLALQPAPITGVLHDLHMRMQIFQSSGVLFYIQFEDEMTIPLALEITKKATG